MMASTTCRSRAVAVCAASPSDDISVYSCCVCMISGFSLSARRRYCELPVSGKNVKRFLQFRLGCHKLPIATGRCTGVAGACRLCHFVCWGCGGRETSGV